MALRRGAGALMLGLTGVTTYRYNQVKKREKEWPKERLPIFDDETSSAKKRVLIIGAGVVGVSTAYELAQKGYKVAVLERASAPGEECTNCAAGGMSRQNVVVDMNTWIAVLKQILPAGVARAIWGSSPPFQFFQIDWLASVSDPFFLRWAWTFTQTSFFPHMDNSWKQSEMLKFTEHAVDNLVHLLERDNMGQVSGYNTRGSLAVSYEEVIDAVVDDARKGNTIEPSRQICRRKLLEEEPSLRRQEQLPTMAKYEYESKAASSGRFTKELALRCRDLGVSFWYKTKVQAISTSVATNNNKPRISEITTNRGTIKIPDDVHVVVAAGAWTPHVLALMYLYAPVYPLKGYAMSVSAKEALEGNPNLVEKDLPSRIVSEKFMYTSRLGDEIRITSIGEFSEWNTQPTDAVDRKFRTEAIRQFPQLSELIPKAITYCGHRPFVADGLLLLGVVDTHSNLYVTCGPGSNGWKLAVGSGDYIARLIGGQTIASIKQELGFDGHAFSPAGRVLLTPVFSKVCRARWNV